MSPGHPAWHDADMGLLTEDPVPAGFTGTRIGRLQPLRGDLRDRADARGAESSPGSAGTRLTRSPAATSAPRASRWPTSTPTPTGSDGRCAGSAWVPTRRWEEIGWDEAYDLVADRLAATIQEHGANAVGRLSRQPQRALGRLRDPRGAVREGPADPQPVQRLHGRPDPAPVRGLAALRPPADAAHPGHRPDVVLPDVRRQPDGLQRLADDRPRLPAAGPRPQGAGRASWWCSTRAAPRPPRSPPSTTSSGPAPTQPCCSPWCTCSSRRGSPLPRRTSTTSTRVAELVAAFTPERAEPASGVPADDDPAAHPRVRGGGRGGGVRPDGAVDPGLRLGVPVGDPAC